MYNNIKVEFLKRELPQCCDFNIVSSGTMGLPHGRWVRRYLFNINKFGLNCRDFISCDQCNTVQGLKSCITYKFQE
jgi:hypothetical protein